MITQTEGIIIINDKRERFQTEHFRSLATLPNPANADILAEKFAGLQKFSDCTLAPQKKCIVQADSSYCVVLIPLVGAIEIDENLVGTGEIAYCFLKTGEELLIQNPYESEFINYLEIWFQNSKKEVFGMFFDQFDLDFHSNSIIQLKNQHLDFTLYIGKYFGKVSNEIDLTHRGKKAFAFNISGSIEVQERLLYERDAVVVWDCDELGYETLANESILLLITANP